MEAKNTGFKIEHVFEEYKEQIKLMENQYGQEEDLYPWIYMLLMESGIINNLSMRQVANAPWANSVLGREMLRGYASWPDIAIVDKEFYAINISEKIDSKKKYIANWIAKGLKIQEDCDFVNDILVNNMKNDDELKEFLRNYWYLHNIDKIRGCVEVKKIGDTLVDIKTGEHELIINYKQDGWYAKLDSEQSYNLIKKNKLLNPGQLFGELFWYGKVLYTNGLKWKYLEVIECCNNTIKNIANLRKILYKDCVYSQEPTKLWCEQISKLQKIKNGLRIKIKCVSYPSENCVDDGKEDIGLKDWIKKNVCF